MTLEWLVSGVNADRWRVQGKDPWRPPVAVRRQVLEVPRRHGTLSTGRAPVFAEPTLALTFAPLQASHTALETAVNELVAVLAAPTVEVTRISGDVEASARVELESISHEKPSDTHYARVVALFKIPGVFFRGEMVSSTATVVSDGATVSVPHLAAGTGPVEDAMLRVRGPLASVQVTDVATGTGIAWSGTALTSSDYLYLDPLELTARVSGSSSSWESGGTDVSGGVDYPVVGPLQVWPVMAGPSTPGTREAKVRVTGTGFGGTTSLMVRGEAAYL